MNVSTSVLVLLIGTLLSSSTVFAAIDIKLSKDIELIATNGQEVGMRLFKKRQLELDNGLNQLVVRVAKLVRQSNGEFEKFNSDPVIITFEADDQRLSLDVDTVVNTVVEANKFNQMPSFVLTSQNGLVRFEQELLPRGPGITRDYDKEIFRYNSQRNIPIKKANIDSSFSQATSIIHTSSTSIESADSLKAIQLKYQALSDEQKKAFLSWAVSQ